METKENNKQRQSIQGILLGVMCIMVISSTYIVWRSGAVIDLPIYSMFSLKNIQGDLPMKDIYGPYALSASVLSIFYRFVGLFSSDYTYGILFIKGMGIMLQAVVAFGLYCNNRKTMDRTKAIMISLLYFCFLPDYLYCFVNHYTILYWIALILAVLLGTEMTTGKVILTSALICLGVVTMPAVVLMCIPWFVIMYQRRALGRSLITMVSIGGSVLAYLMIRGMRFGDIFNLLKTDGHDSMIVPTVKRLAILIIIGIVLFGFDRICELVRLKIGERFTLLVIGVSAMSVIASVIQGIDYINLMRTVYFSVIALGIWALMFAKREIDSENLGSFKYYGIMGLATAGVIVFSTNTGVMAAALGLVIPLVGYLSYRNSISSSRLAATVLILLLLVQRLVVLDGGRYFGFWELNKEIPQGICKGVFVSEYNYELYQELEELIKSSVTEDDKLLIIGDRSALYGYSMTKAENCATGTEENTWNNSFLLEYYSSHPEKKPSVVLVIGESYVTEYQTEKNDIIDYFKSYYYVEQLQDDRLILRMQ